MIPLYENDNYIVFEKPWGISTHAADEGDLGLCEWLKLHHGIDLLIISRLDKETSGPIIFAKNKSASAEAERIHLTKSSKKTYQFIALCQKRPAAMAWSCSESLDGKAALTEFQILRDCGQGVLLVEAKIHSGRKHQIRRHAASAGLPILGDTDYGGAQFPRLMLHCIELEWPGFVLKIHSQIPKGFVTFIDCLSRTEFKAACHDSEVLAHMALDRRGEMLSLPNGASRIVHRGECEKDFAIDRFANQLCVWVYDNGALPMAKAVAVSIVKELRIQGVVIKTLFKNPHNIGILCQNLPLEFGDQSVPLPEPETLLIEESGLNYLVKLTATEQTGFFIDQRDNRRRLFHLAAGRNVANLFAYTCSFSVVAAAAGAKTVVSVDVSKSALREGLENFRLNELEDKLKLKFVPDDVRTWLDRQVRRSKSDNWEPFDVIVCDPPTFGKAIGKSAFRIEKEWGDLAHKISQVLEPKNGVSLFCTNSRSLDTRQLKQTLQKFFRKVERYRTPLDFPESVDPSHNRFYWCSEPKLSSKDHVKLP